jgi:hypothetical protein
MASDPETFDLSDPAEQGRIYKRRSRRNLVVAAVLVLAFLAFAFLVGGIPVGATWVDALIVIIPLSALSILAVLLALRPLSPNVVTLQVGLDGLWMKLDSGREIRIRWADPIPDLRIKDYCALVSPLVKAPVFSQYRSLTSLGMGLIPDDSPLRFWLRVGLQPALIAPIGIIAARRVVAMASAQGLTVDNAPQQTLDLGGSRTLDTRIHRGSTAPGWESGSAEAISGDHVRLVG